MPIERALKLLPERWADVVNTATKKSLEAALKAALLTFGDTPPVKSREFLHKLAVPAIGAAGGAAINLLFIDHFQDMAPGHFIVRKLERAYGAELVRAEYERL
jgi:hypothetical protein